MYGPNYVGQVSIAIQAHLRSGQQTRQQATKKHRTNQMLIAVTVIFVGCWLPLNVIHLTLDYYEKVELRLFRYTNTFNMRRCAYAICIYKMLEYNIVLSLSRRRQSRE